MATAFPRSLVLFGFMILSLGSAGSVLGDHALIAEEATCSYLALLQHKVALQNHSETLAAADGASSPASLLEIAAHEGAGTELSTPRMIESVFPACALVACVVVAVYWPQGPLVISRILLYIFALSSMKLSVKFVYSNYGFSFPKFLTAGHLSLSSAVGFAILMSRYHFYDKAVPVPTSSEFVWRIGPIASAFAFSLAMNNSGLVYCSAAFAEIVGSTTPLVTVAVTVLLGIPFNKWLLLPTLVVMVGATMSVSGELNISVLGTMFVFAANVGRAVKSTLQQDLLTGETRAKFDPCALLAWTCLASALIMLVWSVISEGAAPLVALQTSAALLPTLGAIFGSCLNACMLNLVVLYVTKDLGAVGQLIAGQVAAVLTVGGGVVIFGDKLSPLQVVGFITVLAGAFAYSRMAKAGGHGAPAKAETKAEPEASAGEKIDAPPEATSAK